MTISKERRDAIRAAAEKATPGPWRRHEAGDDVVIVGHPKNWPCSRNGVDGEWEVATVDDFFGEDRAAQHSNAAHIANCDPQTILALLDALDAAEAEPVAWMYPDGRAGHAVTMDRKVACDAFPGIANPVPLYAHAAPAPAVREGWVTVPVKPTKTPPSPHGTPEPVTPPSPPKLQRLRG